MRYLPLHVHSAFSFLWGCFTPQALVETVASRAGAGVALADHNGLYGMVRLAKAGQERLLYTLCGARVSLAGGGSLLLYPRDAQGHGQLCRLITRAHLDNPRGKPRLDLGRLPEAGRLFALAPGRELLSQGLFWLAQVKAACAGPLCLGLPGPEVSDSQRQQLRQMARQAGLDCLAAPEVVALDERGLRLHAALAGIARGVHHRYLTPLPAGCGRLPSDEEMRRWFAPQEIAATWRVQEMCDWRLDLGRRWLPDYPLPPGRGAGQELARRCLRELARRRRNVDRAYAGRLLKELSVIESFGFSPYFLLVDDIVSFARQRRIRCTVRGSAAGSVVTWLLCGGPDPVEHDLLFERFLNDGRREPPDVDLDFDSLRRDEVLRHVMERYPGQSAMVATVPTFRARSAVRELCLAGGASRERAGQLTEFIPHYARAERLSHLLASTPELRGHPLAREKELLETAAGIGGLPRQLSVHLGGVALGPLAELVPVEMSAQNLPVAQLDKDDIEALGLIKMDLLGLRMHSAISQALEAIAQRGQPPNLERLPLDDKAVYDLLCSTDTLGLFQVESPGQRGLLGRLQPRDFGDLMVEISLFRPGPMRADMITPFLERRAGRQPVTYAHPLLKPILKETLGVVVFQEQVLKIAHFLAGLSYGQADGLRRAMTHKRTARQMDGMRHSFVGSCQERGLDEGLALLLWDQVSSFASYGFPKSHAAAFAMIAYQSAWLRVHHPLEYFVGLLNAGHVGGYPPRVLLNQARRLGFAIHPPDVNRSRDWYLAEGAGIRVGLLVIRGLGPAGAGKLLAARREGGPFLDMADLLGRGRLNRAQVEALRLAGALACLTRRAA